MESLSILSGLYANIDPEIFQTLSQGWQTNHCVKIAYAEVAKEVLFPFILSQEGNVRLIEPAELKTELKRKLQKMLAQC